MTAGSRRAPLVVVEGTDAAVEDARAELRARGWTDVLEVTVAGQDGAEQVVLAALAGRAVLAAARADRATVDRLCDDLRRLGHLDHRVAQDPASLLTPEQHELLRQLSRGSTLGEVAARLHLSRRSADRRLAAARMALGAATTSAAVAAYGRRLARLPAPENQTRG